MSTKTFRIHEFSDGGGSYVVVISGQYMTNHVPGQEPTVHPLEKIALSQDVIESLLSENGSESAIGTVALITKGPGFDYSADIEQALHEIGELIVDYDLLVLDASHDDSVDSAAYLSKL